jgi:hypothetical protein
MMYDYTRLLYHSQAYNGRQIRILENNATCRTLCVNDDITPDQAKFINERIREDYALNWLVDGLPAAEMKVKSPLVSSQGNYHSYLARLINVLESFSTTWASISETMSRLMTKYLA